MIVISGITSALGIHLSKQLVEKGYRVRGFARTIDKAVEILNHPSIELFAGDLREAPFVQRICKGAEGVIHLAALSKPWGRDEDFYSINVEGTRTIASLAREEGVKRFVHVSSPSIYFDFKDRLNILESDPLPPKGVNLYATTKWLAEGVIVREMEKGLQAIILRPRAIFGPHDQVLLPRVLKICQERGIPCFRRESPIVDITYISNVVDALCLALNATESCVGQAYNITNGDPMPLWELLTLFMERLSIPCRRKRIPYAFAKMGACFSELAGGIFRKEPRLTRYSLGVMSYSQTLSIRKAEKELGYKPIISIQEGIDRYAEWLASS